MAAIQCQAVVDRIDHLAYNVKGLRFRLLEPPQLAFKAGQFIILNLPHAGKIVKRAYSIASAPHETHALELCIQHVEGGIASTYFWKLKEGDLVSLSGPHGNFLLKEPVDYDPVFMATGTGIAPLRSMIKHLVFRQVTRPMWLFFGCRYEHALLYESEFRSLANLRPNFRYIPTVSRPREWHGEVGHIQQTFQKYISPLSTTEVYLCGWLEVVKAIYQDLQSLGVPKEKLHYEEWA